MSEKGNIAYQNKDITAKYLEEHFASKSFSVYGIDVPKIVQVLPTNLPIIEANELRLDNLFLLEDGSLALVDYESVYADVHKIKYLNYIIRTLKRSMNQENIMRPIRMIVIYTADIKPEQTRPKLDAGCLQFQLEEAFLMKLDSKRIESDICKRLDRGEELTEEELMQFIILPLTYEGKTRKQECIRRCFEMAKKVEDETKQIFLLAGMLVFSDKVVDTEDSKRIQEWIMMTKVAKLFEEEKIEYGRLASEKAARESEERLIKRMLEHHYSIKEIMDIVISLTEEDVRKLSEEINKG